MTRQNSASMNDEMRAAMSFREIGEVMGMTTKATFTVYQSALNKLRRRSKEIHALRRMADELQMHRPTNNEWRT